MIIVLLLMLAEFRFSWPEPPRSEPPRLNYERIIFEAYYDDAFEWTVKS